MPKKQAPRETAAVVVRKYEWSPGMRNFYRTVPAQVAGEHIERLADRNGGFLTTEAVVADAASPASPIHPCFEWDDTAAAHQHRLLQARQMCSSIAVVLVQNDEPINRTPVVAFVHTQEKRAHGYVSTERALASERTRAQVLNECLMYLRGFQRRYQLFEELAPVFAAVAEVEALVRPAVEAAPETAAPEQRFGYRLVDE